MVTRQRYFLSSLVNGLAGSLDIPLSLILILKSQVLRMKGHEGPVYALYGESEQGRLYSCGMDATIRVWDAREES